MSNAPRQTKNEKREHAREQARLFREAQARKQRTRRFLWQGAIIVVIVAIVATVTVVVVNLNNQKRYAAAKSTTSGPANMLSDGILFAGSGGSAKVVSTAAVQPKAKPVKTDLTKYSGKANIVEYIDLQCPYCDQFETTNGSAIKKWVAAGKATVEIHPISFLDSSSLGNKYSTRGANALACVANYEPSEFLNVVQALYRNQPAEDTKGEPDSKLISVVQGGGAKSTKVAECITGQTYKTWVSEATLRAQSDTSVFPSGQISTPAVFVNGQQYSGTLTDASTFASFVDSVVPGATS